MGKNVQPLSLVDCVGPKGPKKMAQKTHRKGQLIYVSTSNVPFIQFPYCSCSLGAWWWVPLDILYGTKFLRRIIFAFFTHWFSTMNITLCKILAHTIICKDILDLKGVLTKEITLPAMSSNIEASSILQSKRQQPVSRRRP